MFLPDHTHPVSCGFYFSRAICQVTMQVSFFLSEIYELFEKMHLQKLVRPGRLTHLATFNGFINIAVFINHLKVCLFCEQSKPTATALLSLVFSDREINYALDFVFIKKNNHRYLTKVKNLHLSLISELNPRKENLKYRSDIWRILQIFILSHHEW